MISSRRTTLGNRTEELLGIRDGDRALRLSDLEGVIYEMVMNALAGQKAPGFRLKLSPNLWISTGTGTPEGAVTAPPGCVFIRADGAAGTTLYVKESGTGNTGWVAK